MGISSPTCKLVDICAVVNDSASKPILCSIKLRDFILAARER